VLLLAIAAPAMAQEKPATIKVIFRTLALSGHLEDVAILNEGGAGDTEQLIVCDYRRSGFVVYEGPPLLTLYERSSNQAPIITATMVREAAERGEKLEPTPVLARIDLTLLPRKNLLLLFAHDPDPNSKWGWRVLPINEDPKVFPRGTVKLYNATTDRYYANVNGERTVVEPGRVDDVAPKDLAMEGVGLLVRLGVEREDEIEVVDGDPNSATSDQNETARVALVASRSFALKERQRMIIFIRPSKSQLKAPSISAVVDDPALLDFFEKELADKAKRNAQGGAGTP